jgi:hypothetical protein
MKERDDRLMTPKNYVPDSVKEHWSFIFDDVSL